MTRKLNILGIILARGGSKGLPNKNIKSFCDKPLLSWTISQALKSNAFNDVVVSTDSEEISKISTEYGAYVPFLRPKELAADDSPSIDSIIHAIEFLSNKGKQYDAVCLLEPTSPMRRVEQISLIIEDYEKKFPNFTSLITVGKVRESLDLFKTLDGDRLLPYNSSNHSQARRQDLEDYYFPYGVAYIADTKSLIKERTFYTSKCSFYKLESNQCFEIDNQTDFDINELMFKKYYYNDQ